MQLHFNVANFPFANFLILLISLIPFVLKFYLCKTVVDKIEILPQFVTIFCSIILR